jgi:ubiquinone/menaquinone biosynthesis C-methylase UbiE
VSRAPNPAVVRGYDAFYAAWGTSATLAEIWREHVTGADFPAAFDHISFLPLAALAELTVDLRLAPGDVLVDLACGAGGPGLWAAAETGARLVGVDVSVVAVARATARAEALGMAEVATFRGGTFADTGLDDGAADAVMTVDALQYAPDKAEALREVARVLRPGGRFSFLTFELETANVEGRGVWEDAVGDFRPLLDATGFTLITYDEVEGWRRAVTDAYTATVEQHAQLAAELGEDAAGSLVLEAALTLELDPYRGHARIVAERRA